jgi:membrane protease YdiL (CAAX protease family)
MDDYTAVAEPPAAAPEGRTPWGIGDIAKAIGLVIALTVLISIPSALVASLLAGDGDLEDDPTALSIVLGLSIVLEALMLWAAYRFSIGKYHVDLAALGLKRPERGTWMAPFAIVIGSLFVMYVYFGLLAALGLEPDTELPEGVFDSAGPFLVLFALSVFVAPPVEEVFFRGFVFGGLRGRWGTFLAAIASGALFGLAHLGNPGTFYLIPPVAAVGAVFAYGYVYTGSIIPGIIAHFLFNFMQVMLGLATS